MLLEMVSPPSSEELQERFERSGDTDTMNNLEDELFRQSLGLRVLAHFILSLSPKSNPPRIRDSSIPAAEPPIRPQNCIFVSMKA
ncbi:hypothetical protein GUJ93_ZPchr0002g25832 [Zizania palustris]|uniref:Uncharacterized protein n=1 Tax=Zizania palustris TaxID=103762 RepID=A0A8J5VEJ1_ZIZPA|nr:hypothetical protein GUJ93_ZPchr0002g25832 [Zizania palustris]